MLAKWIFNFGAKLRNPSLWANYRELKKTEQYSIDQLEALQLQKLKTLLKKAKAQSSFYANSLKYFDIDTDINSLSDLKKLPLLTKEEVLNYSSDIQIKEPSTKYFKAKTSGSSGESLVFYRNETADSFNRAAIIRGYSWYGVKPWDRNGYFWGFNFGFWSQLKIKFLDGCQNRFRLFSFKASELSKFSNQLNSAIYLHGYSSMIYELAKYRNKKGLTPPKKLKLIKGTSEKIWPYYQDEVEKAFGNRVISEYGATESGIIAFECPKGNMHITMEGVIVEEVENEIVVTNLELSAFPIIRYKLGDYIKLSPIDKVCGCGRSHQMIEEVTGRVGDLIYGMENQYPSLYFYYVFKNLAEKNFTFNYQVIQEEKGNLKIYIEQQLDSRSITLIDEEMYKYFQNDIKYQVLSGVQLERANGKLKSFISKVNYD
ncbi:MAG: capsule biosynthesis protein CapK [Bacteroidetes bacterium MedPE-SWsnd-G2]|nr:MAG: capsule biosynthesis protein CapK [Bacteroidetes bacterium MedPE-SWsnd-G2]